MLQEEISFSGNTGFPVSTRLIQTKESGKKFFLKSGNYSPAFRCEANGLKEIRKTNAIRCPEVIAVDDNFILTEYISQRRPSSTFFQKFAEQFACMHRFTSASFGFYENNFIGANPQLNIPEPEEEKDWITFYFNKRLLYQYHLAEDNHYVSPVIKQMFIRLEKNIHKILEGSENIPCLLHGDLWSGNFLCNEQGEAVIIDPAVYYGNREADLAMTKVFGGFPDVFYEFYNKNYPLADGWEYRENIYKLYHILNHLNLFGRSYLYEAESLLNFYF